MFSKRQLVFLIAIVIIGSAIGFNTAAQNKRIRRLAATEAKLAYYSSALEINRRYVDDLAAKFRTTSEHRKELQDSIEKRNELESAIQTLRKEPEPDSKVKWATGATVLVEEFIVPRETAEKLLGKFDRRDLDQEMREELLARPNHVRFQHRFETVVLPALTAKNQIRRSFEFGQQGEFTTSFSDTTVGELSPIQHARNTKGSYASGLEELIVHTALGRNEVTSRISFTLRESAGFTLGTWSIYRIAEPFQNPKWVYRIQLDTQLPVAPNRFQYIGSSPFQVRTGDPSSSGQNQGTMLVFTKVDFHNDGKAEPAVE